MNCHFSYWNDYNFNLALQAMIAAHVKLVRAAVYWDHIQYAPDKFRWEYADRLVNSLQKNGIAHNWCVYPVPKWAVPENVRDKGYSVFSRTAPMPGLYGKFMEILAERYREKFVTTRCGMKLICSKPSPSMITSECSGRGMRA
ncbi:MAG: hypothetical protein L6W00_08735 [Lentisphaeria bacterium]|nr:MAG: hypothetical protein L6W00_08735 [Lentisphaeria bacterium]